MRFKNPPGRILSRPSKAGIGLKKNGLPKPPFLKCEKPQTNRLRF
ncbi:hypothetical protein B4098_1123 [Heyndrickxia coagulans]|uniref:Uncharacterized protein n=1 Tax=Heyndrickxia coagulans TaxID=1398 RepID=A0A150JRM4_HEYCO|nr:hypothetical protein B4098_1123 [Heyndrickxia coagulans]